jgi:hypothetical protein
MKYTLLLGAILSIGLMAMGELSKSDLRDFGRLVSIDGVIESTNKKNRDKVYEVLRIDYSSEEDGLDDILFRVAVELTDKKTKETYLAQKTRGHGNFSNHKGDYIGEGYWEFIIPCGSRRLKITGYAVEYGVMDGETFVPLDADYDDVKSFDELTTRTTTVFPGKVKLSSTYMVDGY